MFVHAFGDWCECIERGLFGGSIENRRDHELADGWYSEAVMAYVQRANPHIYMIDFDKLINSIRTSQQLHMFCTRRARGLCHQGPL